MHLESDILYYLSLKVALNEDLRPFFTLKKQSSASNKLNRGEEKQEPEPLVVEEGGKEVLQESKAIDMEKRVEGIENDDKSIFSFISIEVEEAISNALEEESVVDESCFQQKRALKKRETVFVFVEECRLKEIPGVPIDQKVQRQPTEWHEVQKTQNEPKISPFVAAPSIKDEKIQEEKESPIDLMQARLGYNLLEDDCGKIGQEISEETSDVDSDSIFTWVSTGNTGIVNSADERDFADVKCLEPRRVLKQQQSVFTFMVECRLKVVPGFLNETQILSFRMMRPDKKELIQPLEDSKPHNMLELELDANVSESCFDRNEEKQLDPVFYEDVFIEAQTFCRLSARDQDNLVDLNEASRDDCDSEAVFSLISLPKPLPLSDNEDLMINAQWFQPRKVLRHQETVFTFADECLLISTPLASRIEKKSQILSCRQVLEGSDVEQFIKRDIIRLLLAKVPPRNEEKEVDLGLDSYNSYRL